MTLFGVADVKTMTTLAQQQMPYMNHNSGSPPHTQSSPCSQPGSGGGGPGGMNMLRPPLYSYPHGPPLGVAPGQPGGPGGIPLNPQMLPAVSQYNQMNNLANQASKKRKYESPNGTVTPALMNAAAAAAAMTQQALLIKAEPGLMPPPGGDCDDDGYGYDFCAADMNGAFMDGTYQVIKWQTFQPKTWATLLDHNYKEL